MEAVSVSNGETLQDLPRFHTPHLNTLHGRKAGRSAADSKRRHSLPHHFLPPSLWNGNISTASLIHSGEEAHGEHNLAANRISALRELNGATRSRHRYAKSTGARSSTFSQPVIVRTYSGGPRARSEQRDLVTVRKANENPRITANNMEFKLPPVEAFSFKGIMDEIKVGVAEDLERIAEICARSKYSLSNQYEVHMPPHGRGDPIFVGASANGAGPTLQAIGSDDEQTRPIQRGSRRRVKSAAMGTLETIMSSSRSSDEDKSRKKPAAVIAEEVRGRAVAKMEHAAKDRAEDVVVLEDAPKSPVKYVRPRSATFASMIIDKAQHFKTDATSNTVELASEPARPQTSTAGLNPGSIGAEPVQFVSPERQSPEVPSSREEHKQPLAAVLESSSLLLGALSSWLPWIRPPAYPQTSRRDSHAELSLRDLLKATSLDHKGKMVDRGG